MICILTSQQIRRPIGTIIELLIPIFAILILVAFRLVLKYMLIMEQSIQYIISLFHRLLSIE